MQLLTAQCPYCGNDVETTIDHTAETIVCPQCDKPFEMAIPVANVQSVREVAGFASMTTADYLQLLDWTARQIVGGQRSSTPSDTPPMFARLRIKPEVWCELVTNFGILFSLVAGQPHRVDQFRSRRRGSRFHLRATTRELLTA